MTDRREHWERVYAGKAETEVSWYQPHSERSLQSIRQASPDHSASVIDVGGGASRLVDDLLDDGFADIAVLDLSEAALAQSKARLGERAAKVAWIVADVTQWRPARTWAIWHDRAVFHFLTEPASQDAYVAALKAATTPGATVVLATFALDGPEKCSGLPVQRYSPVGLAARLGPGFALTAEAAETHLTPWGAQQKFSHAVLKRLG